MAQGKARNKEKVIEVLKPLFQLGYSVRKACLCGGIPESTFRTWFDADEDLRAQVSVWQNEPNTMARKVIVKAIQAGNVDEAKWWSERREKDEFSMRQEVTGSEGGPVVLIDAGQNPYSEGAKKYLPNET